MTYRYAAILILGLALALAASFALFAAIQNSISYVAVVRGQFYTPVPNPPTGFSGFLDRATSKGSLMLLRFAVWPFLIFLVLECASGYAISRLVPVGDSVRRVLSGFLVSLGITAVCLAGVWASFARTVHGFIVWT